MIARKSLADTTMRWVRTPIAGSVVSMFGARNNV